MLHENTLRAALGRDFEAKLAGSSVFRALETLIAQTDALIDRLSQLNRDDPQRLLESEQPFPLFEEEQAIIEQVIFLNSVEVVLIREVEISCLPISLFLGLSMKLLRLIELWIMKTLKANKKKSRPLKIKDRTILIPPATIKHILRLIVAFLQIRFHPVPPHGPRIELTEGKFFYLCLLYEDLEMVYLYLRLRRPGLKEKPHDRIRWAQLMVMNSAAELSDRVAGRGDQFPFDIKAAQQSELSAKEYALELLGKDNETRKEEWCVLEMQIIWCRYVRDEESRSHAI